MEITLKDLRKAKQLTQMDVAVAAGISYAGYNNLERGRSKIAESNYKTVYNLAKVLGEEVYDIARTECEK